MEKRIFLKKYSMFSSTDVLFCNFLIFKIEGKNLKIFHKQIGRTILQDFELAYTVEPTAMLQFRITTI